MDVRSHVKTHGCRDKDRLLMHCDPVVIKIDGVQMGLLELDYSVLQMAVLIEIGWI